jgi:P-type Cu+ transporter
VEKREAAAPRVLAITGMTCNGCVGAVTRVLSRVPGVASVEVERASGRALVAGAADAQNLVRAVEAAGYGARLV